MVKRIFGEDVQVGDTLEVWFGSHRATVIELRPYRGPLDCLSGAWMAEFAEHKIGMTIEPGALFTLLHRQCA